MKRLFLTISSTIAFSTAMFSQLSIDQPNSYYIDGLRLSQNDYSGTARSTAMGNAFSSLGGDMGSFSINPAGIGIYRASEFTITPSFGAISTSTNYLGNKNNDIDYKFDLGNIGMVLNFNSGNSSGWIGSSLAFGYNRLNNFSGSYYIEGSTNSTSMANEFIYYANGLSPDNLDENWERLAYDAYLINPDTTNSNNFYTSPYGNVNILQQHHLTVSGSSGEYYFGFGTNINNQLYLGASLNLFSAFYTDDFVHTESDMDNATYLNYYTFSHYIKTHASGFTFKLGAIYRVNDMLKFGLAFHTPTINRVNQESYSTIQSSLNSGDYYDYSGQTAKDIYDFSSPFKAIAGGSVTFQEIGLISLDYEFIDYRSMHFSNDYYGTDLQAVNQQNSNTLRVTNNLRVGGELKLGSAYLRGGYAFYASPFSSSEINKNANTQIISGGIGYRNEHFFIDFTYSLTNNSEKYFMYNDVNLSATNLNTNSSNFMTTIGFRF